MRVYLDAYRSRRIFTEAAHRACGLIRSVGAPSGLYQEAMFAVDALDEARGTVLKALKADGDVVFTSGGTEANNLAIVGAARANPAGRHIVVSAIDQPSVLAPAKDMTKAGFDVDFVGVTEDGTIDLEDLAGTIRRDTTLVSVQSVNQEVGAIQPLSAVVEVVQGSSNALLHTDATYAIGRLPVDLSRIDVDLLSFSSHRLSGPIGAGALYVRPDLNVSPHVMGDTSYHRFRGGTENVPAVAGMGVAVGVMCERKDAIWRHTDMLRRRLLDGVGSIEATRVNSPAEVTPEPTPLHSVGRPLGMPDLANVTFNFAEGEAITLYLDMEEIAVSTGSACASWNLQANYVLMAMGRTHEEAHGSIRFSFDENNTTEEIDRVVEKISEIVERLRSMSAFKPKK
ncbi:MAG: cysteine desulfurase [Thermoplasmata archaeon]|nr:cysteine desulfurase [Thermoplasmata archaeon]